MTPKPPKGGLRDEYKDLKMSLKDSDVILKTEFKVPLGGFRGGFLAELAGCNKESGEGTQVRMNFIK
jgi:hypothetical protein